MKLLLKTNRRHDLDIGAFASTTTNPTTQVHCNDGKLMQSDNLNKLYFPFHSKAAEIQVNLWISPCTVSLGPTSNWEWAAFGDTNE